MPSNCRRYRQAGRSGAAHRPQRRPDRDRRGEPLEQVATVKLAGDEERYSRLDLVDANANVKGAQQVYDALRPIVLTQDPELVLKVDTRFATLEEDLAQYNLGASFAALRRRSASRRSTS